MWEPVAAPGSPTPSEEVPGSPAPLQEAPVEVSCPRSLWYSFFLFGIGSLLPWSALMSTRDFYVSAFVDIPFDLLLTLCYMLSMGWASVYLTLYPRSQSLYTSDITAGFAFFTGVTLLMPFLGPSVPESGWTRFHLWAVLSAVASFGVVGALTEMSMFAVAALFPYSDCTKAINMGGGLAGVIFALVRMATLLQNTMYKKAPTGNAVEDAAALFAENRTSTFVFFCSCGLIYFICVLQAIWVSSMAEWKETMHKAALESSDELGHPTLGEQIEEVRGVLSLVWEPFAAVWLTFSVTLGLYPAVFFNMRTDSAGDLTGRLSPSWFSIWVVTMFCLGDYLGKAANFETFRLTSRSSVLGAASLRIAFCPLVILAAAGSWKISDWGILLVALFFGGTNGLVTGASFVLGPTLVEFSDKDKAGKALFLGLMIGISSGALLGPIFMLFVPGNLSEMAP